MRIDLIERYRALKGKIDYLREDIKDTEKALKDPKLDWLTATEYKNDISNDRRQLLETEGLLNGLYDYLYQNKLTEEIGEISRLKEEENNRKK